MEAVAGSWVPHNNNNVIWDLSWHQIIHPITRHQWRDPYCTINAINIPFWFLNETFKHIFISYKMKDNSIFDIRSGRTATWGGIYLSTTMWKISEFLPATSGSQISWCTTGITEHRILSAFRSFSGLERLVLFSFGFWVSRAYTMLHQCWVRARSKPDTRHQHINLAYLPSCWIITSIHRITHLTPNIAPDLAP